MDDPGYDILVLGIGNLLWADEGFGVRAVEALEREYVLPERVRLMDGGTQGLYLVPYVQQARRVLVLDAVEFGGEPGTLTVLRGDDVLRFGGTQKVDVHQMQFQDVLFAASILDGRLEEVVVVGVQPLSLVDFGGDLSEPVRAAVPSAIDAALQLLSLWGVVALRRNGDAGIVASSKGHERVTRP